MTTSLLFVCLCVDVRKSNEETNGISFKQEVMGAVSTTEVALKPLIKLLLYSLTKLRWMKKEA